MRRSRWENFLGPEIDFESDPVASSGLRKFWRLGFFMREFERAHAAGGGMRLALGGEGVANCSSPESCARRGNILGELDD
jgi:hypothetical protein